MTAQEELVTRRPQRPLLQYVRRETQEKDHGQRHQQQYYDEDETKQCIEGRDEPRNVFLRMWDGKTLCWTIHPSSSSSSSSSLSNNKFIFDLQNKVLDHYPEESTRNFYFVVNGKVLDTSEGEEQTDDDLIQYFWPQQQRKGKQQHQQQQQQHDFDSIVLSSNTTIFVQYRNRGGFCFMMTFMVIFLMILAIIGSPCTCGISLFLVPLLLPMLLVFPLFCL